MSTSQLSSKPEEDSGKKKESAGYERFFNMGKHLRRIGISDSCRTMGCRHTDGCLFNTINQTVKGFSLGYASKTALNLIGVLMNIKKVMKKPSMLIKALVNKESFRFGLFPAVYNLIMHALLCIMKRKNVNPRIQTFLSGFIAGFISLATRQAQNRQIWGIFLLARAFDCFYQSLCNKGYIKKRPMDYQLIFSLMYILVGYCYACEPDNLPYGFNKFIRQFSAEHGEDLAFRRCWVEKKNIILRDSGYPTHDCPKCLILDYKRK